MSTTGQDVWPTRASGRELLRLAWPLILGNSFWTLQIVLDRVLLGQSSSTEVGAALSAALIFWTGLTLFQYTVNYATTFVAQYTGAGQPQRVGPGSVLFAAADDLHGVQNVGDTPATYYVIKCVAVKKP